MEWHITPIARKSYLTQVEFAKDDKVGSALVRMGVDELARVDALVSEFDQLELPGEEICRWTQIFKPKPSDGREEAEALKLTADNLFLNLFEGEEEGALSQENAELKHLLGLMLERRRVLRVTGRNRSCIRYLHRPSKKTYLVPALELSPAFFRENMEKLAFIVDGGAGEEEGAAKEEGKE